MTSEKEVFKSYFKLKLYPNRRKKMTIDNYSTSENNKNHGEWYLKSLAELKITIDSLKNEFLGNLNDKDIDSIEIIEQISNEDKEIFKAVKMLIESVKIIEKTAQIDPEEYAPSPHLWEAINYYLNKIQSLRVNVYL